MFKKTNLLVYCDNYHFGGSEKLISFLVKNPVIKEHFNITLAYRDNKLYRQSLKKEFANHENKPKLRPVSILSNASFFHKIELLNIKFFFKKIIKIPFYVIEKTGFYDVYNFIIQVFLIKNLSPSIIHINNGGYPGANSCSTMVSASRFMRLNSIIYQINNATYPTKNYLRSYFDKYINDNVNYFITGSKHAKEMLVSHRSFDNIKIIQVNNTILEEAATNTRKNILNELGINQDNFIICNIGFLQKGKGQKYLLEALSHIRDQEPIILEEISLLIVGNGEEEFFLKQYSTNLNLNKHVHFLGYKEESVNYINCCDLFVFPSIAAEDMPLVILSAMNLGRTIIATDLAGIKEEIEDKKSGILISANPETLSQDLANSIIELYHSDNSAMRAKAKERYSRLFSNSAYGKKILDIYKSSIRNR